MLLHASCVVWQGTAVLLRGPSGAGKSDLALRLIQDGATLVADDQVRLQAVRGRLWAAPPESLAGLLEVRGLGILQLPYQAGKPVGLVVDLTAMACVERLPQPARLTLAGCSVMQVSLCAWEASAPIKVRLAMQLGAGTIMSRS
jgi:serine kinase of HPr protein (carbohydrate metabolism regulator)